MVPGIQKNDFLDFPDFLRKKSGNPKIVAGNSLRSPKRRPCSGRRHRPKGPVKYVLVRLVCSYVANLMYRVMLKERSTLVSVAAAGNASVPTAAAAAACSRVMRCVTIV